MNDSNQTQVRKAAAPNPLFETGLNAWHDDSSFCKRKDFAYGVISSHRKHHVSCLDDLGEILIVINQRNPRSIARASQLTKIQFKICSQRFRHIWAEHNEAVHWHLWSRQKQPSQIIVDDFKAIPST